MADLISMLSNDMGELPGASTSGPTAPALGSLAEERVPDIDDVAEGPGVSGGQKADVGVGEAHADDGAAWAMHGASMHGASSTTDGAAGDVSHDALAVGASSEQEEPEEALSTSEGAAPGEGDEPTAVEEQAAELEVVAAEENEDVPAADLPPAEGVTMALDVGAAVEEQGEGPAAEAVSGDDTDDGFGAFVTPRSDGGDDDDDEFGDFGGFDSAAPPPDFPAPGAPATPRESAADALPAPVEADPDLLALGDDEYAAAVAPAWAALRAPGAPPLPPGDTGAERDAPRLSQLVMARPRQGGPVVGGGAAAAGGVPLAVVSRAAWAAAGPPPGAAAKLLGHVYTPAVGCDAGSLEWRGTASEQRLLASLGLSAAR